MGIEYGIYDIGNNRYAGRVINSGQVTEKEFLDELDILFPEVGRSKLTAIFEEGLRIINEKLADNFVVHTPLVSFRPSVKGSFSSRDDHFNPDRNEKDVSALRPRSIQKEIQKVAYTKVAVRAVQPHPVDLYDAKSQTHNDELSLGGMGELSGDELNFNQSNDNEGIFFRALSDATEIKVTDYLKVTNNRIIFSVPSSNMPAGEYVLLVRRSYTVRKEVRTGELNVVLTLG